MKNTETFLIDGLKFTLVNSQLTLSKAALRITSAALTAHSKSAPGEPMPNNDPIASALLLLEVVTNEDFIKEVFDLILTGADASKINYNSPDILPFISNVVNTLLIKVGGSLPKNGFEGFRFS